jgi:hypothetical protein
MSLQLARSGLSRMSRTEKTVGAMLNERRPLTPSVSKPVVLQSANSGHLTLGPGPSAAIPEYRLAAQRMLDPGSFSCEQRTLWSLHSYPRAILHGSCGVYRWLPHGCTMDQRGRMGSAISTSAFSLPRSREVSDRLPRPKYRSLGGLLLFHQASNHRERGGLAMVAAQICLRSSVVGLAEGAAK